MELLKQMSLSISSIKFQFKKTVFQSISVTPQSCACWTPSGSDRNSKTRLCKTSTSSGASVCNFFVQQKPKHFNKNLNKVAKTRSSASASARTFVGQTRARVAISRNCFRSLVFRNFKSPGKKIGERLEKSKNLVTGSEPFLGLQMNQPLSHFQFLANLNSIDLRLLT